MSSVTRATKSSKGIPLIVLLPVMAVVGVLLGSGNPLTTIKSWSSTDTSTTIVKTETHVVTVAAAPIVINHVNKPVPHTVSEYRLVRVAVEKLHNITSELKAVKLLGDVCITENLNNGSTSLNGKACNDFVAAYWENDDNRQDVIKYIKSNHLDKNEQVLNTVIETNTHVGSVLDNKMMVDRMIAEG